MLPTKSRPEDRPLHLSHRHRLHDTSVVLVVLVATMSFYVVIASYLTRLPKGTPRTSIVNTSVIAVFVAAALLIVWRSHDSRRYFRPAFGRWRCSIIESLVATAFMIVVATILTGLLQRAPVWPAHGLTEFPNNVVEAILHGPRHQRLTMAPSWVPVALYAVSAPAQEWICRGVIQRSLQQCLSTRNPASVAIVLSNLVYAAFHVHFSIPFAAAVFICGSIWGAMYVRHRCLVGVCLSHTLLGVWCMRVLGVHTLLAEL